MRHLQRVRMVPVVTVMLGVGVAALCGLAGPVEGQTGGQTGTSRGDSIRAASEARADSLRASVETRADSLQTRVAARFAADSIYGRARRLATRGENLEEAIAEFARAREMLREAGAEIAHEAILHEVMARIRFERQIAGASAAVSEGAVVGDAVGVVGGVEFRASDPCAGAGSELCVSGNLTLAHELLTAVGRTREMTDGTRAETARLEAQLRDLQWSMARRTAAREIREGGRQPDNMGEWWTVNVRQGQDAHGTWTAGEIVRLCNQNELQTRRTALHSLAASRPEELLEVLRDLRAAPEEDLCAGPLRTLALEMALHTSVMDVAMVRELVADDPDVGVRRAALGTLASSSDPETIDILFEWATSDSDRGIRLTALSHLVHMPDPVIRARVWTMIEQGEVPEDLLPFALSEFSRNPVPDDIDRLKRLFSEQQSEHVQASILAGLASSEREEDQMWVRGLIADETLSTFVRSMALNQVGWRSSDLDFLTAVYRDTPNRDVRRQILWGVAASDAPGAAEFLIQAYRDADHPEIRQMILGALGQRDDDRAREALRAVLRGEVPR